MRVRNAIPSSVTYNLLSGAPLPLLDTGTLSIDNCPGGNPPLSPADHTRIMEDWIYLVAFVDSCPAGEVCDPPQID